VLVGGREDHCGAVWNASIGRPSMMRSIHSYNRYFLNPYSIPDTVLGVNLSIILASRNYNQLGTEKKKDRSAYQV
jgi:hypothetical protein